MTFDTLADLAGIIDHTLLRPDATRRDIDNLCEAARAYGFCAVCINPWWVTAAAKRLLGCPVKVCSTVGFPLGMTAVKFQEARKAAEDGAEELDMVLAVGALKSGDVTAVENDIRRVTGLGLPVKVILETGLLTIEEIRLACRISIRAGAAYVKTGTGFGGQVATVETVRLLAEETRGRVQVKASGGIWTLADLADMVAAGADRIGTSRGVQIAQDYLAQG